MDKMDGSGMERACFDRGGAGCDAFGDRDSDGFRSDGSDREVSYDEVLGSGGGIGAWLRWFCSVGVEPVGGRRSLLSYYVECITKKHFRYSGRATRRECFGFFFYQLVVLLLFALLAEYGSALVDYGGKVVERLLLVLAFLLMGLVLLQFLPSIYLIIRRLHDTGRSGWHWLWLIVVWPCLLYFLFLCPSQRGVNRYGEDPFGRW